MEVIHKNENESNSKFGIWNLTNTLPKTPPPLYHNSFHHTVIFSKSWSMLTNAQFAVVVVCWPFKKKYGLLFIQWNESTVGSHLFPIKINK